jgi:hypothetical protein
MTYLFNILKNIFVGSKVLKNAEVVKKSVGTVSTKTGTKTGAKTGASSRARVGAGVGVGVGVYTIVSAYKTELIIISSVISAIVIYNKIK